MPQTDFNSLPEMFLDRVASSPELDAFYFPKKDESWATMKWADVGTRVRAIAGGLRALGVDTEQRVAILASTRVEWILADLGILCGGGATTTIYPSNTPEECEYIISDSGTVVVFAEDDGQIAKLKEIRERIPQVHKVITFDGSPSSDGWVISLNQLEEQGNAWHGENPSAYEDTIKAIPRSQLATLIYTSGTTGTPKGVELLHDCWVYTGMAMKELGILSQEDKQFLWLPMSHSFGKVLEAGIISVGIPTAIDGRIPRIIDNLAIVRPTFMAAAPRIFEKVYNKVVTGARDKGGLTLRIFNWSIAVGKQVSESRQKGREPGGLLGLKYRIADKLVFSKLKDRFGGRIRFFISGSAPLSRDMAEFFHAADMLILEGYGLTESSAASYINLPKSYRFGSVGKPMPGTKVKIDPADGEILLQSRGIMRGYYNKAEVTAETLHEDEDGIWLRTGDIGEITSDGFLKITDRKKNLIKTSGGKYVAPQHLESRLKALCTLVSQVVVHGDRRNYCTALVTLDEEAIMKWAQDNGMEGASYGELAANEKVKALVQPFVDQMNSELPSYSTVKKFALLPADFAVETGELTPSLKVKRKVVEKKYADVLDGFYKGSIASM